MLGRFQSSHVRIEVPATAEQVRDYLTQPAQLRQWLWPLRLQTTGDRLQVGETFTGEFLGLKLEHRVELLTEGRLVLVLRQAVEGWQEWSWGDGWVQSCIEGVTPLPLELGQTFLLWRLKSALNETVSN
ncbi:SRPBCC domain-containing protein [Thermosynechococcus sp.]|uniref:SRPBCC family protein n=1 Tax=Thermosynechococcus sp. TaxID=2814275 RepID=UPI00391BDE1C